MRLPVTPQLGARNGVLNRDGRMTNALSEKKGELAAIRPGLVANDTYTGIGNGLIPFDGRLLVVHDDTVDDTEALGGTFPLDSGEYNAATNYNIGDAVWYNGVLWFSVSGSTGVAPSYGGDWANSYDTSNTYDPSGTYAIGDSVMVMGVPYYSLIGSNTGNDPNAAGNVSGGVFWSTTDPGTNRYFGNGLSVSGATAGSHDAAFASWLLTYGHYSCATRFGSAWYDGIYSSTTVTPTTWNVRCTTFQTLDACATSIPLGSSGDIGLVITKTA